MQHGKRSAQWDHTAALITHIRLSAGDKSAKATNYHPFAEQPDSKKLFKTFTKGKSNEPDDL